MTTWIAFLRGVNIRSNRRVPMPVVRDLLVGLGHADARTWIVSGNAWFTSRRTGGHVGIMLPRHPFARHGRPPVTVAKETVGSVAAGRTPLQADVRDNDRVPGGTAGKEALMFRDTETFSSFAVPDVDAARRFYGETLGLEVTNSAEQGLIELHVGGGAPVLVYPKPDHKPAVFTVLNFVVPDIDASVRELNAAGVQLQRYDLGGGAEPDELGIYRGQGPSIGWFTDPAGNILSVLERPAGEN